MYIWLKFDLYSSNLFKTLNISTYFFFNLGWFAYQYNYQCLLSPQMLTREFKGVFSAERIREVNEWV